MWLAVQQQNAKLNYNYSQDTFNSYVLKRRY